MDNLKTYYQFVKPYRKLILLTLFIGMIKFAIPLMMPLLMKYVVDDVLLADTLSSAEKLEQLITVVVIGLALFVIVRGPVEYIRQYFAQLVTSKILFDIRNKLYEHIQKLSIKYYQNRKVGEIISRFINDVEQTKSLVEIGLMNIWLDLFTLTIALGIMFYLNWSLTLVAIMILPLYAIAVKILYKRLKVLTKNRSQALAEIQAYLHERIQGIPIIRSFTLEPHEMNQFKSKNRHFLKSALAHTRWNALTFSIINTLTDIAPLLVIGYGGYLAIYEGLSIGALVAFFGYLDRLYSPLRRLVNSSTVLTQSTASLERVIEFMSEPYDLQDAQDAYEIGHVKGKVELRDVKFKYNKDTDWILKQVSLTIEPGSTVALVGASGGGKSSLVSLLPRFYDIQSGSIHIDHHNIQQVTMQSLRKQMGMVLQDNILFSGSVRDNILLGKPGATEEEVLQAARLASAHDFITDLPQGYDTEIGERGVKLSGGQKQRISIARVFLKNPSILILDEATSALDLESEQQIQLSLRKLAENRTTIVVAHRLSTITHADNIVYIQDGKIVEQGTHQQLMQQKGDYAKLYNLQNLNNDKRKPSVYNRS
ncbi:ABC transporter ATP-binding protein [Longirhabdus pacifica]|uniref:ABC transporter ATP-binding protein n=1 Tax=Longirhabdus pacifica TaxID=2305227 RepID=UPI001008B40A|nr:ABC transporter ATP-binding protein [Longirhabdus pacifica]